MFLVKTRRLQRIPQNCRHGLRGIGFGDAENADIVLGVVDDGRQISRLNIELR